MADPTDDLTAADLHDDHGWASRKLALAIVAMAVIVVAGVVAGLAANLPTVVGGVVSVFAVYCGASAATTFAAAGVAKTKVVEKP